jgi:hypothetical protein
MHAQIFFGFDVVLFFCTRYLLLIWWPITIVHPLPAWEVKSHAGVIGNEHADVLAKKSATTYSDIEDTSINSRS